MLIISTHGDLLNFRFTSLTGVLLALSSAVLWALFWIANVNNKNHDDVCRLFVSFLAGLVFVGIAVKLFSDFRVEEPWGLMGAAYIGFFEMGVTFIAWSKALSFSKTTADVSQLIYLFPGPRPGLFIRYLTVTKDTHESHPNAPLLRAII